MRKNKPPKYTADELFHRLEVKYDDPQRYVVASQVANATGACVNSWIDVVVFFLWPSDGLRRAAFEIKVSRSDWLKELQQPLKNEDARKSNHEFWYLAPADVIKEEELPKDTGWMKPHGQGLSIVRHPVRHTPVVDDSTIAALIRSVTSSRYKKRVVKDLLEKSRDYRIAQAWKEAGEQLLRKCGQRTGSIIYQDEPKIILEAFEKIINNESGEDRVAQSMMILDEFQTKIIQLLHLTEMLAAHGLYAADDAGVSLSALFGYRDTVSRKGLKDLLKTRIHMYDRKKLKRKLEAVRDILGRESK